MIEANELRIGNYLSYNGIFDTVDEIGSTGLDLTQFSCLDYIDVEPIPLTEEWLLKFDFEKRCIDWMLGGFFIEQYTENFFFNYHGNDLKLEYVHQVQNLHFALTGEELTLKN